MNNSAKISSRPSLRSAEEKVARLDAILENTVLGRDLFSSEITALRNSLKDELEQLILFSSHEHVIFVSQELLWRKVYYEVINYFKMLRANNSEMKVDPHLKMHILSGIGTYHLLLKRFQSISVSSMDDDAENKRKYIKTLIFKFTLALGDLSRYHADVNNGHYRATAESYYRDAIAFMPNDGLPFNQLGTLYHGFNYSLDSIYYHIRGLLTEKPFQGTEQNLKRLFIKNMSLYKEIQIEKVQASPINQVKKFVFSFVRLIDIFYSCPDSDSGLSELCQNILQDIPECLPMHQDLTKAIKLEYIPRRLYPDISFKIMVTLQMIFIRLQSNNNAQVTASVAFLFAFMSHIVCYVISACRTILPRKCSCSQTSENSSISTAEPENQNEIPEAIPSTPETKKKHKRRRFKGRRRRFSSSDSDSSDDDSITSSDLSAEFGMIMLEDDDYEALSETEAEIEKRDGILDSTAASLNASEELAFQVVDFALNENASDDKEPNNNDGQSTPVSKEEEIIYKKNILYLLGDKSYLCTIKVFCDWLRSAPSFLESCATSSQNLWSRLAVLVNYLQENALPYFESDIREELLILLNAKNIGNEWVQPVPLHEDVLVQDFPGFENVHSKFIKKELVPDLNDFEQIAVRLKCLNQFCHFFSTTIENVDLKFNAETNLFSTPVDLDDASFHDDRWITQKYANNDPIRMETMQNMTHLWLKAEVSNLENSVKANSSMLLSPYLVLHSAILIHHLPSVKKLTHSKKFIVVIPVIVIDTLDAEKKTSMKAREASRWLEMELKKGNRFLRAQKQYEKKSLAPMKYPRRKDKQQWDAFHILECCNHIIQRTYSAEQKPEDEEVSFVTLLISKFKQNNNSETNFDAIATLAASIGVRVEDVKVFCSRVFKRKNGK